jgi:hypothetical protein
MDMDGAKPSGREVLLSNFELLRVLQGDPMVSKASDGEDITVLLLAPAREAGVTGSRGAEASLTDFQLTRVLQGDPMVSRTSDGEAITVRLPTPDELLEDSREKRERLIERMKDQPGWSPPPPMTRAQAEDLARPYQEP